jgi:hypothetical protein
LTLAHRRICDRGSKELLKLDGPARHSGLVQAGSKVHPNADKEAKEEICRIFLSAVTSQLPQINCSICWPLNLLLMQLFPLALTSINFFVMTDFWCYRNLSKDVSWNDGLLNFRKQTVCQKTVCRMPGSSNNFSANYSLSNARFIKLL